MMAEGSSPAEVDYLDLCGNTVRSLEDVLALGEHLLNQRQCKDLSSKLSKATRNVRDLVLYCETSIVPFRPALEIFNRCLGKAEALVRSCAEEDWCAAAVLQIQNENAFRNILLDVRSCYKTIYELAKSTSKEWNGAPEDLEQFSVFEPAGDEDVRKDQLDLEKRLNDSAQDVFLNLCRNTVLWIRNLVKSGKVLLNQRQCVDLSTKLCKAALNVFQLVSRGEASVVRFQLALESLYRFMEKAKALVNSCAGDDWLAAAVFQIDNENAFRMILLDVSLCYNAIYELAKCTSTDWDNPPEDLRQPPSLVFKPAQNSDVDEDKLDLKKRLDDLANGYTKFKPMDYLVRSGKISRARSLAKYLLLKMSSTPSNPQVAALDMYSAILWRKNSEPMHTWGGARFLGAGSGASGVVSTTWLDIPCAKKEFHGQVNEGFFLKEAGILVHLKHPCVVDFVCCGNGLEKGDRFIAMELMEKSLADLIEERNGAHFPLPVVVDMMVQIAHGVYYLHGRGVAHRDLKPQNVVVKKLSSPHGESHYCVKLVDFGMSKTKVEVSKFNTMSALGIGTTRYRAPELGRQAHPHGCGKAVWFEADVFSFAMTCAHLLSLKAPFGEMEALHELYKKLMSGVRPTLQADCPKELVALLEDCWSTRPKARPTLKEVCIRLEKFKYGLLKGFVGGEESDESNVVGFDFIKGKVEEESSNQVMLMDDDDDDDDDEEGKPNSGELQTLACPCGHTLEFLPQLPSSREGSYCNICWEDIAEEFYQCRACDFEGHSHCLQLKLEVNVFFHQHPLHLLIQNYHNGDPNAICCFCEESVQHSEWVYRCEQCDIDVHAMCIKYPEEGMRYEWHEHPLILIQCPPRKSFSCVCCNGTLRGNPWRYTCLEKWCTFDAHPSCLINSGTMVCVFDNAHCMHQIRAKKQFYCGSCGGFGFSWCYQCDDCDVNIHLDCIHNMVEEDNQDLHFEEFGTQHVTKDDLTCVGTVKRILHKLLVSNGLGENSSLALEPTSVAKGSSRRVQPTIRRLASSETPHLDAIDFDDVDLCNKVVAEAEDRKARRTTAKARRLESKAKYLERLENVERIVLDMRSSESVSPGDGEVLEAGLEELKIRKNCVKNEMATLVQSKMRHGPRTCLFFLDKYEDRGVHELLTSLRGDMEDVCVLFVCEEPSHPHFVDGSFLWECHGALGEERVQRLQPLLGRGLEVVARAVSESPGELTSLDRVILPFLGWDIGWDLQANDLGRHGKPCKEEENAEALKRVEDSAAEWLLSEHELKGWSVFKFRGLLRVRYKVTEEGDCPGYTRGSVAWLCQEHVQRGLEAGILESYPLKFYDPELN